MKKLFASAAIIIAANLTAFSQVSVKGTVAGAGDNSRLGGATIKIRDSYKSTFTGVDGTFSFSGLKKGKQILEISYVGFKTAVMEFMLNNDTSVNVLLAKKTFIADEVVIKAVRADVSAPVTSVKLDNKQLEERNLGQDITYMLSLTPSAVVTSDAGAGVGYTGIRIRGTDATRINVTINGIPVNDAESQGTYWVDLPDIISSVDNLQIQRGVGTSTNGAGAFGASLNIQTTKLNENPYANINSSFGSFNTLKNTVSFGTGLINKKWAFDGRISKLNSDGFVDRAFSDLKSFYVSGGYYGKKSILKLILFSGKERTYQAWYGVPKDSLETNRTFNVYNYYNQTDNYQQDYYQLHYSYELNKNWDLNAALHYTKGAGYYEEFKDKDDLAGYGLNEVIINQDTIRQTDIIRRRWLDNDFYGATYSVNYDNHKKVRATLGGAANKYNGGHFGEVIWAQFASNSFPDLKYYNDTALKNDVNVFCKINYQLFKKLSIYGDLQYRTVYYSFFGFNDSLQNAQQAVNLNFVNPKAGLMFRLNNSNTFYASLAVANKEPNRDDYVQSIPGKRPMHETLRNIEAGYSHKAGKWMLNANYYYMCYKNQLVLTGQINDVGAYNRTNTPVSFRSGIEIEAGIKPLKNLDIEGNITLSKNIIKEFTEYIDNWDDDTLFIQKQEQHNNTCISFSPSVIAGGIIRYEFFKNAAISLMPKYVGMQYLDNTSDKDRSTGAYFVNDLQLSYSFKTNFIKEIKLTLLVNNILNELYESNGWTYPYFYGGVLYNDNYYYPQAGRNFLAGITARF